MNPGIKNPISERNTTSKKPKSFAKRGWERIKYPDPKPCLLTLNQTSLGQSDGTDPCSPQQTHKNPPKFPINAAHGAFPVFWEQPEFAWIRGTGGELFALCDSLTSKPNPLQQSPPKKWKWGLEIQPLEKHGTCGDGVILQPWSKNWAQFFLKPFRRAEIQAVTTSSCSRGI